MAIALEFIDFVVPVDLICQKYRVGWEQCLKDHERLLGGSTLPCEWLELSDDVCSASLKGTGPGPVIGRPPDFLRNMARRRLEK